MLASFFIGIEKATPKFATDCGMVNIIRNSFAGQETDLMAGTVLE